VQPGDLITAVGNTPIPDVPTLPRVVAKLPIGQPTQLTLLRDGQKRVVSMIVDRQPDEPTLTKPTSRDSNRSPSPPQNPRFISITALGLEISNPTPALLAQYGYPPTIRGAIVTAVERNSRAAEANISRGQIIVKVDARVVVSADDCAAAIAATPPDRGALIQLLRPSGEVDFTVLRVH
jgi:serine protease Do